MAEKITGECLCGAVEYAIDNDFKFILFCHCSQCRQITGSAHASNLFSATESLEWLKGEENIERFRHPERNFSKTFCRTCGSGLPRRSNTGPWIVVPAGSLKGEPKFGKNAEIFLSERTDWTPSVCHGDEFPGFPTYFDD